MDILPSYDIWAGEVLVEGGDEVGNMDWRTLAPEDWDDPAAAPEEDTKWSDPEFDEPEPNTSNIQSNGDSWLQIELCIIFILILQIATKKLCLLKQNIMNYYEGEIMKQ